LLSISTQQQSCCGGPFFIKLQLWLSLRFYEGYALAKLLFDEGAKHFVFLFIKNEVKNYYN
jgi:hypothetical protein